VQYAPRSPNTIESHTLNMARPPVSTINALAGRPNDYDPLECPMAAPPAEHADTPGNERPVGWRRDFPDEMQACHPRDILLDVPGILPESGTIIIPGTFGPVMVLAVRETCQARGSRVR